MEVARSSARSGNGHSALVPAGGDDRATTSHRTSPADTTAASLTTCAQVSTQPGATKNPLPRIGPSTLETRITNRRSTRESTAMSLARLVAPPREHDLQARLAATFHQQPGELALLRGDPEPELDGCLGRFS